MAAESEARARARREALPSIVAAMPGADWGVADGLRRVVLGRSFHGNNNLNVEVIVEGSDGARTARRLRVDLHDDRTFKRREFLALRYLNGRIQCIPEVFSIGDDPPRLVSSWLPSIEKTPEAGAPGRMEFLSRAAEFYDALHRVPVAPLLGDLFEDIPPAALLDDFRVRALRRYAADGCAEEAARSVASRCLSQDAPAPHDARAAVIQESPSDGNLVVYEGRPYFLDWDTVRVGAPERDLAAFLHFNAATVAEAECFLGRLDRPNLGLVARYLFPVALWKHLSRSAPLTWDSVRRLDAIAAALA